MLIYHFTPAGRLPWIMQSGFWERRYGTRTTHGVAGDEELPTRADKKFGKTGGRRSAKRHTSGTTAQAKTAAEQPV